MAKRKGAYKSEKRKKELMRQKKQEMKRQKRVHKDGMPEGEAEHTADEGEEGDTEPTSGEGGEEGKDSSE